MNNNPVSDISKSTKLIIKLIDEVEANIKKRAGNSDLQSLPIESVEFDKKSSKNILYYYWINTPLDPMLAIASKEYLHLLEFVQCQSLEVKINRLYSEMKYIILPGSPQPIISIKNEVELYFAGKLKSFKTPIYIDGTDFQKKSWKVLIETPFGTTRYYKEQASIMGKPSAFRAVANANGSNKLALIIPCHRIINSNGALGGYGGGLHRKKWMLDFEFKNK